MGHILIGTTSWTEKTLIESGLFYPPDVRTAEARLRYYAERFPIVEVDSSYYTLPSERNALLWVRRTPEGFVFDIKAFRLFTQHQTPPSSLPADVRRAVKGAEKANLYYRDLAPELLDELWSRFRAGIAPLKKAGKLGVVLFQFPPWFPCRPASLEHIVECARRLEGCRVATEFRNRSWFDERHREQVIRFERANGLAHVVVDEPQGFSSSVPAVWEVGSPDVVVVRLHGRNRDTWRKAGLTAAERFNYLYSVAELRELVAPIREIAARVTQVHVLFNNCHGDYAVRNAAELRRLVENPQADAEGARE
ncbi:MAG TPA: DUF72 domain-containing protein [candidate division Zixibacteria bacterium]|nr:DUF72 domain-containing protein [candidate division Zixibacteria bacterium]